jgi:hypothetical protein
VVRQLAVHDASRHGRSEEFADDRGAPGGLKADNARLKLISLPGSCVCRNTGPLGVLS